MQHVPETSSVDIQTDDYSELLQRFLVDIDETSADPSGKVVIRGPGMADAGEAEAEGERPPTPPGLLSFLCKAADALDGMSGEGDGKAHTWEEKNQSDQGVSGGGDAIRPMGTVDTSLGASDIAYMPRISSALPSVVRFSRTEPNLFAIGHATRGTSSYVSLHSTASLNSGPERVLLCPGSVTSLECPGTQPVILAGLASGQVCKWDTSVPGKRRPALCTRLRDMAESHAAERITTPCVCIDQNVSGDTIMAVYKSGAVVFWDSSHYDVFRDEISTDSHMGVGVACSVRLSSKSLLNRSSASVGPSHVMCASDVGMVMCAMGASKRAGKGAKKTEHPRSHRAPVTALSASGAVDTVSTHASTVHGHEGEAHMGSAVGGASSRALVASACLDGEATLWGIRSDLAEGTYLGGEEERDTWPEGWHSIRSISTADITDAGEDKIDGTITCFAFGPVNKGVEGVPTVVLAACLGNGTLLLYRIDEEDIHVAPDALIGMAPLKAVAAYPSAFCALNRTLSWSSDGATLAGIGLEGTVVLYAIDTSALVPMQTSDNRVEEVKEAEAEGEEEAAE
ncbi:hypothetical protein KIPB_004683 [Kipferlia bialata]|uniref:Uncharacterized protein n=1 Tax=Kipferlia bialata TaxID=797122 RepID=A0A9K3CXD1_9EUKA|nr:hypothetical protein KIPB_004683 [Kipferlia bialata]|eukprot:g4683.t1